MYVCIQVTRGQEANKYLLVNVGMLGPRRRSQRLVPLLVGPLSACGILNATWIPNIAGRHSTPKVKDYC